MIQTARITFYHQDLARPTKIQRSQLAETIRRLRTDVGYTQAEFARRLGITGTSVAKYETNAIPEMRILERLAKFADQVGAKDKAMFFRQHPLPYLAVVSDEQRRSELLNSFLQFFAEADMAALNEVAAVIANHQFTDKAFEGMDKPPKRKTRKS